MRWTVDTASRSRLTSARRARHRGFAMRSARTMAGAVGAGLRPAHLGARRQRRARSERRAQARRHGRSARRTSRPRAAGASSSSPSSPRRRPRPPRPSRPRAAPCVDVTEGAGVALVSSPDAGFLDEVREDAAIAGAARNHSVGTSRPGMPHQLRRGAPDHHGPRRGRRARRPKSSGKGKAAEPLADLQWDMAMIGATPDGAWTQGDRPRRHRRRHRHRHRRQPPGPRSQLLAAS